jgi:hypothetical protein
MRFVTSPPAVETFRSVSVRVVVVDYFRFPVFMVRIVAFVFVAGRRHQG